MKIRSDFVTNSSSSSFIFKGENVEIMLELKRKEKERSFYKFEGYDWQSQIQWAMDILSPMPILSHSDYNLDEVISWYESEIYKMILPDYPLEDLSEMSWNSDTKMLEDYFKNKAEEGISDEEFKKLMGMLVLEFLSCKLWDCIRDKTCDYNNKANDVVPIVLSEKEIEDYFSKYIYDSYDHQLYTLITNQYDKALGFAKWYSNKGMGVILEELIGPIYMYFSNEETPYKIYEDIIKMPECILHCNHMG